MYQNQRQAIDVSIQNRFQSGVHAHATGTGKSWIALQLALEYINCNVGKHILWVCEQKSILQEQFSAETIQKKGFDDIKKRFIIKDYSTRKTPEWPEEIAMATIWRKPLLVIINRAFLVSGLKYEQLRTEFGLIIHDECHSIVNSTTRAFYEYMLCRWPNLRCIGFSATPVLEHAPFNRLLSQYSIYDGVKDGVILPPKIHWLKSDHEITLRETISVIKGELNKLPYKKILVWCGMIHYCEDLAKRINFPGFTVAIDTSRYQVNVEEFMAAEKHAIMFCAAKHREGSDIKNLDCCIFMDDVQTRDSKVFVQCVGRTLRRDSAGLKKYGLIIDISALSSIKICDRINQYLSPNARSQFPFTYDCDTFMVGEKYIKLHTLMMGTKKRVALEPVLQILPSIFTLFVRGLPSSPKYSERLRYEIEMINSKNLMPYILQAIEILKITEGIPHVTRGSCGSSLLCYALGISNVDPVAYNISFARFLTKYRSTLPDIDFDFPYNLRDEVFLQLELRWPGAIARISNHVFYHKKSALREAIRRFGIRRQIKSVEIYGLMKSMKAKERAQIDNTRKSLENTFKCYSLHCGGIVFYPEGVPDALKLQSKMNSTMAQVILNKHDVAKDKNFKIDILSSRALAQLYEAGDFEQIVFDNCEYDEAVADMFCRGDNIGITLAESPLCRKAFMKFRPRSVHDLAMCLAIIRPAARAARKAVTGSDLTAFMIYDDDAINIIADGIGCDDEKADYYRRGLTKGDATIKKEFDLEVSGLSSGRRNKLLAALKNLRSYSFCKSHAYSYAQLVWKLGVMKVHNPKGFWSAALKHCQSSYKRWVLLYEAHLACVDTAVIKPKSSIYAKARRAGSVVTADSVESLRRCGYWDFAGGFIPGCYYNDDSNIGGFRGIIAASRYLSYDEIKTAVLFVCVEPRKYIEVIVKGKRLNLQGKVGIEGSGKKVEDGMYDCEEKDYILF